MNKKIYQTLERYLSNKTSRRDFIQALTAVGVTTLAAESLLASMKVELEADEGRGPAGRVEMFEGTAGAALVEQLKAAGVKYIFHTNTTGVATMMDGVDMNKINVIMVTHEGQAVSTAEGYALASNTLGFFVGSKVGVGNSISNLYNAWKDRTPLIVSYGRSTLKGQGGQDGFEEWDDHLKPTEPFTAWNWSCVDAETMPKTLRRAMKFAFTPPGAPVTLDFPGDLLTKKIRAPILKMDPKETRPLFRAGSDRIEKAAELLAEAKNPIFIVGSEITRGGATKEIVALAEKLSVPVAQDRRSPLFSDFPTHHPLFLSEYSPPLRFPQNIDLVVNLGGQASQELPKGVRLVHASSDADVIGKHRRTDLPILAHVPATIADLSDALDGILTKDRQKRIRSVRLEKTKVFTQGLEKARQVALRGRFDMTPISWERVGYELEQALDKDAVLVPELGSQDYKALHYLRQGEGQKHRIGRSAGSALGWGVGAALGVQLALPDRQVVSIQGDGGFMFGQSETLWSMARYDAPVLVVIMNNHSYNETRNRNLVRGGIQFEAGRDMTSYLGSPDIDFAKMASAYDIRGEKVSDPNDLAAALQRAVKTMRDGRPYMLDLEVSRDGLFAESTWYPEHSIAKLRKKKA